MTETVHLSERGMPQLKHCLLCGLAMLGRRKNPASQENDYFECLGCGSIIDYSGSDDSLPLPSDTPSANLQDT